MHHLPRSGFAQIPTQFGNKFREVVTRGAQVAAHSAHGGCIGAGRTAQTQIDALRVERCQRAKLLSHYKRRMVRQHDAAAAHADGACLARDMPDQDRRRGTRQASDAVVLSQPVARVSQPLHMLRRFYGARDGCSGGFTGPHAYQIKNRNSQRVHAHWMKHRPRRKQGCHAACGAVVSGANRAPYNWNSDEATSARTVTPSPQRRLLRSLTNPMMRGDGTSPNR